ncbi:unnamed protein product [Auanema sp. JU1783]|nr:unnamed protein product [Auanema sp. JU1783]
MEPFVETPVNVIVMVNSHPSESQLRREIRKSWGDPKYYDRTYTRLIFLVGRPVSQNELEQVVEEHRDFNDILVADIKEDYYLLSIKTYAMLYYKMTKLPQTRCLVKADSDNVLNLHNYEKLCEETIAPRIVGSCDVDTTVLRTKSKWAIPVDIYPLPQWPTYCSSGTYVFCGEDVPERILQSSEDTQFFSSTNFRRLPEDVLFTGIFAEKAGISRKHVGTMTFRDKPAFSCRTRQYTYSIHMHRRKNPISYHLRMLSQEGILC